MGRIKTQLVKRLTMQLIKEHPGKFKNDFNENKLLVNGKLTVVSKRIRNSIAGYVTRLTKKGTE